MLSVGFARDEKLSWFSFAILAILKKGGRNHFLSLVKKEIRQSATLEISERTKQVFILMEAYCICKGHSLCLESEVLEMQRLSSQLIFLCKKK